MSAAVASIDNHVQRGFTTDLGLAIEAARQMLQSSMKEDKIIVLATDGMGFDTKADIANATEARGLGMQLFTVGIGRGVDSDVLTVIADSPKNYFFIDDFDELFDALAAVTVNIRNDYGNPTRSYQCVTDGDPVSFIMAS
jgi:Mg-chelatase subunit ChlD